MRKLAFRAVEVAGLAELCQSQPIVSRRVRFPRCILEQWNRIESLSVDALPRASRVRPDRVRRTVESSSASFVPASFGTLLATEAMMCRNGSPAQSGSAASRVTSCRAFVRLCLAQCPSHAFAAESSRFEVNARSIYACRFILFSQQVGTTGQVLDTRPRVSDSSHTQRRVDQ